MRSEANSRIFYGWWIVAVCLLVLVVHAGCAFYSFGVFLGHWEVQFPASSIKAISLPATLYMLVLGVTAPLVGRLTDRYGPKNLILLGSAIAGAGLMLLSQATEVWHLYVLYSVVGLGMSGAGFVTVSATISNWFTRRRGAAMGIATAGVGVGAFLALLTNYLIGSISWQVAFLVLGALTWVLIIPAVMLVLKTRPEDMGLLPDGASLVEGEVVPEVAGMPAKEAIDGAGDGGWTASRAFRTLPFWLMLGAFFLVGAALVGVLQHEHRFLGEIAVSIPAALGLALTGGVGGLGKVAFGFLADRVAPKRAAILCFGLQLVGLAIVTVAYVTQSMAMAWVFVFVFGFAMGGNVTLQPLVVGELFGIRSFGAIFGWVVLIAAVGSALGPVLVGAMYDASGSYSLPFVTFLVVYAVAIAALFFARRPRLRDVTP